MNYNEIRNELLYILHIGQAIKQDETSEELKKEVMQRISFLLERFELDIKDQLQDLEYKKEHLNDNMETLNYVKEKLAE